PREMLAYIPYRLGFRPSWSVVLVSLQPVRRDRSRVGLVVRVDIDDLADADQGLSLARSLAGHLRADGAGDVLGVVYADLPREDLRDHGPWRRARAHLDAALPWAASVAVWAVCATGYGHVDCAEDGCCPAQGRPLAELEGTCVGAEMVLRGAGVVRDRQDLAVRPAPSGAARSVALRGARDERARLKRLGEVAARATGAVEPGRGGRLRGWRTEGAELWDRLCTVLTDGGTPPPRQLGRLVVFLTDRAVRDAVVTAAMVDPGARRTTEVLEPTAVERAFDGATAPSRAALAPVLQLLTEVAAHAPRGAAAPALGALAYLAWWLGDGARADVLAAQCVAEDPDHRLARLVQEALAAGVPPMWVDGAGDGRRG
ncbi:DUF4192 domain-containing protein, partial [Georgenia sp. 10Sc9-8]|nr:DUF4192 domain-containing protein [Georgenia halotolerans]